MRSHIINLYSYILIIPLLSEVGNLRFSPRFSQSPTPLRGSDQSRIGEKGSEYFIGVHLIISLLIKLPNKIDCLLSVRAKQQNQQLEH